jgi:REP element-mobilizing transposase RayT
VKDRAAYRDGEENTSPASVAMPRVPRLVVPGATLHVVARCNHRAFEVITPEDFPVLLRKLQRMVASYELALYAYTFMSNHIHVLLRVPARGRWPGRSGGS